MKNPMCAVLPLVLLVVLLVQQSSPLPYEEYAQALLVRGLRNGGRRAIPDPSFNLPPCPVHPQPVRHDFMKEENRPPLLEKAMAGIGALFQENLHTHGAPAGVLGIVNDQELVWSQGYGLIDPTDPTSLVDANTIFRIGSVTKLITTLMLFKLRDEGKLSLDDPVSKYVAALSAWPSQFKNNPGITWRTLAGQLSGMIGSGLSGETPCNFFTIWEPLFGNECDITNEEAWKRIAASEPTVPMWQEPHYADSAYAIIGRALESVVGMSWEDYVTQHILKPLGMTSTFTTYEAGSDMAKRVAPASIGNASLPSFLAHLDLYWARPTGNIYSTVNDLAKLASLFMVGQGETQNALGIFSSTLREMLSASFLNDDQMTGYGYPFEMYHTSTFGSDMPPYWARIKAGVMPGYQSGIALFPEIKTAIVTQFTGLFDPWGGIAGLLPAMEQTMWDLQPVPANPGNLTAFAGTYTASVWLGLLKNSITVASDLPNGQLLVYLTLGGSSLSNQTAVWENGNTFRLLSSFPGEKPQQCLHLEAAFTNALVHFATQKPFFGGPPAVVSLTVAADPFYGWVFYKQ